MQILNLLKKYIIDSQIYVSLMGALFATFFMLEQNTFRFASFFLIFITYFSGYIYTKYQFHKFFGEILVINALFGIISVILIFINHNENSFIKWLVIVMLGLLYNSKFLDNYIRKIPLLKVFYVGLVWALVNAWLSSASFSFPVFFISFLFVTALVLPFDIRDIKNDEVVTFPKIIGIQNTKILGYLLVFFANGLAVLYLSTTYSFAFTLTSLITFMAIFFSAHTNSDSYFSFWVESCCALPLLFVILIKYF